MRHLVCPSETLRLIIVNKTCSWLRSCSLLQSHYTILETVALSDHVWARRSGGARGRNNRSVSKEVHHRCKTTYKNKTKEQRKKERKKPNENDFVKNWRRILQCASSNAQPKRRRRYEPFMQLIILRFALDLPAGYSVVMDRCLAAFLVSSFPWSLLLSFFLFTSHASEKGLTQKIWFGACKKGLCRFCLWSRVCFAACEKGVAFCFGLHCKKTEEKKKWFFACKTCIARTK